MIPFHQSSSNCCVELHLSVTSENTEVIKNAKKEARICKILAHLLFFIVW